MSPDVKTTILLALSQMRSDDGERARMAFRNRTPAQMQQQWGQSGRTCAELLTEYERHEARVDKAIKEVQALP